MSGPGLRSLSLFPHLRNGGGRVCLVVWSRGWSETLQGHAQCRVCAPEVGGSSLNRAAEVPVVVSGRLPR